MATREPDAVVMAIGGNDGFNVQALDGSLYDPGDRAGRPSSRAAWRW